MGVASLMTELTVFEKWANGKTDFLHVDTDSQKLKADQIFLGGHGQKWVLSVWSRDSIIDCISQASAYEKQRRVIIARLIAKFRGYKRVKSRTPPAK